MSDRRRILHIGRFTFFLLSASLLTILVGVAAQAPPPARESTGEPISFIGHGALFDARGQELKPTLGFIREAQSWYREDLLAKLPPYERARFDRLERQLTQGLTLDEQSQRVLDAHLLDWLIRKAESGEKRERTLGKNAAMQRALDRTRGTEPFQLPAVLRERLQREGMLRDHLAPFSVTPNNGAAYTAECAAAGVPIPPAWNTDGSTGWVSRGQIPQADLFISASRQAEVFTYQSSSPAGLCIALPRYLPGGPIDLLGVICQGTASKKVCFWDNLTFNPPYTGPSVPLSQFSGGTDLGTTGVCTDCHAGANPFIIHPDTPALGGLSGLGLPTFASGWYEPIVKAGWPQNPGPMPSSGACAGCHSVGGPGRNFPHLSTDLPGYCGVILQQAISRTMPPGAPGSLAGGPHVAKLLALCGLPPANDAGTRGDPHLTTVDRVSYDFQSAGEFVALRGADGLEIQTRQTPVATANPVTDPHTGLNSCVSLNTAVAARVGPHRVTFQPNLSGVPDPVGLELRVDGALTALGPQGLDLGPGGRIVRSAAGNGIEIDFPDGTHLIATPGWWGAPQNKWYLNLDVLNTRARSGILGAMAPGSWLPALPNGTSLGPKPGALRQRYLDLNQRFADAWRVNNRTSLFDYARQTSTATFTRRTWPPEKPPCVLPDGPRALPPIPASRAQQLCSPVTDRTLNAQCRFDVSVTGEAGFAQTYLLTQRLRAGATTITVTDDPDPTPVGAAVTFTAAVARAVPAPGAPTGSVQFLLDGVEVGAPVPLNANGWAARTTSSLPLGTHKVSARYLPGRRGGFLASRSREEPHTVRGEQPVTISNLNMQGGNHNTPCPALGRLYQRADAQAEPYLGILLGALDQQCGLKGPGLRLATIQFLRCAPDPRGEGFGPNASADLTCLRSPS